MSSHLLRSRKFAPLFWCQALSAFNDSYLKTALVFLIIATLPDAQSGPLVQAAGALFMAPSFILSALGGQWADRYDKAVVARRLKLAEFGAVGVAVAGFLLASLPLLFLSLFCFGVVSALFGPVKYGILPDHLARSELPEGNALVEGATFLAVIAGTFVGGAAAHGGGDAAWFCGLLATLAAGSWAASLFIPPTGEAAPDLRIDPNVLRSTTRLLQDLWQDQRLWRGGITVSIFWLVGAVTLALLPGMVKLTLGAGDAVFNVYLALFAIGIAAGSALASWLLNGRTLLLPTPVAAVAMAAAALDLGIALLRTTPHAPVLDAHDFFRTFAGWHIGFDLLALAVAGGLFIVPAFAAVQAWAKPDHRARIVAAVNVLSALFMVAGAVAVGLLQAAGLVMGAVFVLLAALLLAAAAWIYVTLPTNRLRDFAALVFRVFYRLEVRGLENVASAGPNAVIVMNHVSFLDAAVAFSILDSAPLFAIDSAIAQRWWLRPFLKGLNVRPVDPTRPLATRALIQAVQGGETLVIFPEGRITRTGSLMKVYDGAGLIAERSGVPVVPMRIEGAEATPFSYLSDAQVRLRLFKPITVTILPAMRPVVSEVLRGKARRQAAGAALQQIMSDMMFHTTTIDRTLFEAVVAASHEHGAGRVALEDPIAGTLTYKRLLVGAHVVGRKLAPLAPVGGALGVMLPSANGAIVTILGLMAAGRVPAMVNFTAGVAAIKAAGVVAGFTTLVTSRTFVSKGRYEALIDDLEQSFKVVYLEDVRATVGALDKVGGLLRYRRPIVARGANDPAVILFTSGSEGKPKGVVLSSRNMLANAAQAKAVVDFGRPDKVFNVLPLFHSMGLTVGLVIPLVHGVQVYLYPSPLHYRFVPELVYTSNATILFGTDTFLTGYAKAANAYDFRSLRYVMAGAEPVRAATRALWLERFGLRILEGYGVTEAAPVLALNTPMFNKNGSVGRLMPGMECRVEAVAGIKDAGRLLVRGPNVMLGYLLDEQPTVLQPPVEGWHDTGDIVAIDDEGFITIRGRVKRFAKIAGEMVSLAVVEGLAGALWPEAISAAVALPDARRGERILLVTQQAGATRADLAAYAKANGASDLAVPSDVAIIPTVPLLGSGKIDYPGLARLVDTLEGRKVSAA